MEVPYRLRESHLCNGKGLFATADIPKGAIIWRYQRGLGRSKEFSCKEDFLKFIKSQDKNMRTAILHHTVYNAKEAWGALNDIVWLFGDGTYMNHSDNANSIMTTRAGVKATFALRDIKAGEELSENYNTSGYTEDIPWVVKVYKDNGVPYFTNDFQEDADMKEITFNPTLAESYTSKLKSGSNL